MGNGPWTDGEARIARVFNDGCDARLAGRVIAVNPHRKRLRSGGCFDRSKHDDAEYRAWREGWMSVECGWGIGVMGRWPVKPLPDLKMRFGDGGQDGV